MKFGNKKCLPIFILLSILVIIVLFYRLTSSYRSEQVARPDAYQKDSMDNEPKLPPFKFAILPDGTELGYALDVYTSASNHTIPIQMSSWDDEVYVTFDMAGVEEQGALQVFVDYKQVPINIDGEVYRTYFFDVDKNISTELSFQLVEPIDTDYDHSMIVALHANTKSLTYLENGPPNNTHTSAVNYRIAFGKDNPMYIGVVPKQEYERTSIMNDQNWNGLFLNTDIELERERIADKEVRVSPNEELQLLYQIGNYTNENESAIIIEVGYEQAQVNGGDYILVKTDDGQLRYGILTITAPMEVGEYEVTGWAIRDPFFKTGGDPMSFYEAPRFTLIVE